MQKVDEWVSRSMTIKGEAVLYPSAVIDGTVVVEEDSRLELHGTVAGDLVIRRGAFVYLSGVVMGDVLNQEGGTLYIAPGHEEQRRSPTIRPN